ncbi:DUF6131 family protein [Mycobacterium talmoniae]|uniref:Uncharacterized protein n=1 Tax=Mycobacterium talmoniae TaxID=1858794 RepID=A0A2S8BG15_9MYCO|nr:MULTISPECIES: DUF6131 family protein [Mycobacterium]PQM45604.1 hypothetical protein C1Y40_04251 [Mycobacterium talmoniae]
MIGLGVILVIVGYLLDIQMVWALGVVSLVIGAVLWILGKLGRPVAGRRHWY